MQIDNHVPLPDRTLVGRGLKYPFNRMNVGDSLHFTKPREYNSCRVAATRYGQRHDIKFLARATEDGYRVWRVE